MIVNQKEILKNVKRGIKTSFIASLLLLLFAVVLIKNPENFLNVAIHIFGYIAIFLGTLQIVFYIRLSEDEKIIEQRLFTGTLLIIYGFVAFFESNLIKDVATLLLGGYFVYKNASRLQMLIAFRKKLDSFFILHLLLTGLNLFFAFSLMIQLGSNWFTKNVYIASLIIIMEILYSIQNILLLFHLKEKKEKMTKEIVEQ